MTLGDFKKEIDARLRNSFSIPEALGALIDEAIKTISQEVEPLSLIASAGDDAPVFRWIDAKHYIRAPRPLLQDSDVLDIDLRLELAVIHFVSYLISQNEFFKRLYDAQISFYRWSNYKLLNDD